MTRRVFIYVDHGGRKLYASPEFNGDKNEYAQRVGALDSCDLATEELFRIFKVRTLSDFKNACAEAQSKYHSFLDDHSISKRNHSVTEISVSELSGLGADELIFLLKDGRQIIAPPGWDGRPESLYERVRTFFCDTVSLAQTLNRLVTGQDQGFLEYCEGVILSRTELDAINRYLDPQSGVPFQGEDQTIVHTVRFPDGKAMDIKCCGCRDEASWTEAVLFDHHGRELCCSDACDEFEGVWDLQYNGILYTAIIKKEDE